VPAAPNTLRPGELKIQVDVVGGCHTLCLSGELDMASAPELEAAVALALPGAREIVLDIQELTFIDSTGLRVIVASLDSCKRRDTALRVTRARPQARRLFELAGLLDLPLFAAAEPISGEPQSR
jgi:anti-sigma B factor antagonist